MSIVQQIKQTILKAVLACYGKSLSENDFTITETKPEFQGDYTLVTFALAKILGAKPDEIAEKLGVYIIANNENFIHYQVIKGFLNLTLHDVVFIQFVDEQRNSDRFAQFPRANKRVMVEYSSPNTNKPIHFGHLRNNFLGYSVASLLHTTGHEVIKTNLINDRGIHICKSMIAWKLFANQATPQTTGIKGDHFVGKYYVKFNDVYKQEIATLVDNGIPVERAEKEAPIMLEAQSMLRKWEDGDAEILALWTTMNQWVYDGFDITYNRMGVDFDKIYKESETYLLGKSIIEKGLQSGVLFKKEDNSVWIDLTADGLDEKLLLRGNGTAVYITQDIGTATLKYSDYKMDSSVYVIGDEQNYHMQVLKLIMQKLKEPGADGIHHLSYGMVELPTGKMKSREGTVVDADDMMDDMIALARKNTEELGKIEGFSDVELKELYNTLGLGALKFYLLRVDPKKRMLFNPEESIDFHGYTGPFVQYTHARICSILRKYENAPCALVNTLSALEKKLIQRMEQYPEVLMQASNEFNPSLLCNYLHTLAKNFNGFLVDHPILKAESNEIRAMRIQMAKLTKHIIANGLHLLGIKAPTRM
jgi:arginyl-tRNA synthetase